MPEEAGPRIIGLYGDIDDERAADTLNGLIALHHDRFRFEPVDPDDPDCEEFREIVLPIELLISTGGGTLGDMFAIYDTLRVFREECEIRTHGLGRVMSAGVLLLAAGEKGKRKISKNTRLMIHSVLGGDYMPYPSLKVAIEEAKTLQDMMFDALAEETNLTVEQLNNMANNNIDKFFSAEDAVEMGIADIIV